MIFRELAFIVVLILLVLGAITSYVSVKIYHKHDAPLEQFAEEVIRDTTGISIDFTAGDDEEIDLS
jgi:hypothetical protein